MSTSAMATNIVVSGTISMGQTVGSSETAGAPAVTVETTAPTSLMATLSDMTYKSPEFKSASMPTTSDASNTATVPSSAASNDDDDGEFVVLVDDDVDPVTIRLYIRSIGRMHQGKGYCSGAELDDVDELVEQVVTVDHSELRWLETRTLGKVLLVDSPAFDPWNGELPLRCTGSGYCHSRGTRRVVMAEFE
jgi:hypothetical protein